MSSEDNKNSKKKPNNKNGRSSIPANGSGGRLSNKTSKKIKAFGKIVKSLDSKLSDEDISDIKFEFNNCPLCGDTLRFTYKVSHQSCSIIEKSYCVECKIQLDHRMHLVN